MDEVKKAVGVAGEILAIAKENPQAREAGDAAAQSLKIVAQAMRNVLLPFAAVNFAVAKFEKYCRERFSSEIEEALGDTPADEIREPRATVAGPAMEALAWAHEEDELRRLYINLIASAMKEDTAEDTHPAFVQIVRQLDSREVTLLEQLLLGPRKIAVVSVRLKAETGYTELIRHVLPAVDKSGAPVSNDRMPAMVDNWQRLGLVAIRYDAWLVDEGAYDWVDHRPELIESREANGDVVDWRRGLLSVTDLGREFASAVGMTVDRV